MNSFKVYVGITLLLLFFSCQSDKINQPKAKVVLVSKLYEDGRFRTWINHFDSTITVVGMYAQPQDSIMYYLQKADGIILSGGNDIHPEVYNKEEELERCGKIDVRRDSLELLLVNYAMENKIPLLGICRGEQMINVQQGGTLIIDIPSDWKDTSVVHRVVGEYVEHSLKPVANTFLSSLCDTLPGIVKSLHHQAVGQVAPNFRISAYSPDSLPEAIELIDITTHPFVLGVQWHPEKMDYNHHLSKPIIDKFLSVL